MDKDSKIVNKVGSDGIVLDKETADSMFTPLSADELPNMKELTETIGKIMEFITTDAVVEMQSQNKQAYKDMLMSKYKDFDEKYPILFEKIINGDDISMLLEMMTRIDKVKSGKMTMKNAENIIQVASLAPQHNQDKTLQSLQYHSML